MKIHDGRLIGDYRPQKFKKAISPNKLILILTSVSLIWIFLYKLYFINVPQLFFGATEIGEVFYNIFLSIIASAIFFFIVVYLPTKRKKQLISRAVSKRIGKLNYDYLLIKQNLYQLKKLPIPQELPDDFNEIVEVCKGTLLTDKPPHIHNNPAYRPNNWFEYFEYYFELENHNIEHMNRYWEEIPSEVKILIEELEYNTLKSGLESFRIEKHSNNLSDLGGPIWNHLNILRQIAPTFHREWNK